MNRLAAEAQLHEYVDGRLTNVGREAMATRLSADPALAARAEAWTAGARALRAAFDPVIAEPAPAMLDVAVTTGGRFAPQPAATPASSREARRGSRLAIVIAASFLIGAATALVGAAAFHSLAGKSGVAGFIEPLFGRPR